MTEFIEGAYGVRFSKKQPTDADVTEALAILQDYAQIRRKGTPEEVKMINPEDESRAKAVLASAKELGVREIVVPKKNKGGPIKKKSKMMHGGMQKKAEMMGGGMYKGKKHSYAGGGMVKDMKLMRSK